jgi:hypothetical protein
MEASARLSPTERSHNTLCGGRLSHERHFNGSPVILLSGTVIEHDGLISITRMAALGAERKPVLKSAASGFGR